MFYITKEAFKKNQTTRTTGTNRWKVIGQFCNFIGKTDDGLYEFKMETTTTNLAVTELAYTSESVFPIADLKRNKLKISHVDHLYCKCYNGYEIIY